MGYFGIDKRARPVLETGTEETRALHDAADRFFTPLLNEAGTSACSTCNPYVLVIILTSKDSSRLCNYIQFVI